MVGLPWGIEASAAAMLYDRLTVAYPDRLVRVVNMGRTCAYTRDVFYFVAAMADFEPDVVIFYLGSNDRYDGPDELCMPVNHPRLHAALRWLASRSRLAWWLRFLMGRAVGVDGASTMSGGSPACAESTFALWTDILVRAAAETGARVVVTTPVGNDLLGLETPFADRVPRGPLPAMVAAANDVPRMRSVLTCLLRDGCSFIDVARESAKGANPLAALFDRDVNWYRERILRRGSAWVDSATRLGAALVDFRAHMDRLQRGFMGPPAVVDTVHLSVDWNWELSGLWVPAIAGDVAAGSVAGGGGPVAPDRYYRATESGHERTLLKSAVDSLRRRLLVTGTAALLEAVRLHDSALARSIVSWERRALGIDPAIPDDDPPDLDGLSEELSRPPESHSPR